MKYIKTAALLCLCIVAHDAWTYDLSNVRIPDNTESTWVGKGIEHNGIKMDVKILKSNYSSDQILTFYKNMWESGGGQGEGYTINEAGEFKVISKIENNHNIVVQVKNNRKGRAEGYLSAIDLSSLGNVVIDNDFPALSNTRLVSKTLSDDAGKGAVTMILTNDYSVASNAEYYRSRFETDGWKRSFFNEEDNSFMAFYSRNNKTMEIAISKNPGKETVIFVNVVDES